MELCSTIISPRVYIRWFSNDNCTFLNTYLVFAQISIEYKQTLVKNISLGDVVYKYIN